MKEEKKVGGPIDLYLISLTGANIEIVPSLYAPDCPKGIYPEKLLGDGIYQITKQYLRKRQRKSYKKKEKHNNDM